jgi:hypothetical protein
VHFRCSNGLKTNGLSWSFAAESALFGYPVENQYSGDSDPFFDFLPAQNMPVGTMFIKKQVAIESKPVIFKVAWSKLNPEDLDELDQFARPLGESASEGALPTVTYTESSTPM